MDHQVFEVKAKSIVPMLFNCLTPETLNPANKPARGKADEYERNNWRNKMHVQDGRVAIPGEYIEKMLVESSGRMAEKIPGRGNQTYTSLFKAAVFVEDQFVLTNVEADKVEPFIKPVGGQGAKKGAGKVLRYRPLIPKWEATFTVHVVNELITADVFKRVLEYGGKFIGVGDWRPKFGRVEFTATLKQ